MLGGTQTAKVKMIDWEEIIRSAVAAEVSSLLLKPCATESVADPGGGAQEAPPPLLLEKYFKKSPKLAKIYKKILGASPKTPL